VVALHGFNDYSRAFEQAGPYFRSQRMAFYAYDQRGFGAHPQAGIWGHQSNLTRDALALVDLAARRHPNTRVYLLGESMGGAVAMAAAAERSQSVAGLILVSPAVWGGDVRLALYRSMLWAAAHTLPQWRLTGSDLNIQATNNIPLLERMSRDPLIIKSTRMDTLYGLVGMMDHAYEKVPAIRVPTLLLYGGNDQVIPRYSIEVALARFSIPVTFAYYPESYHMMLRDLEGERVMADITRWIRHPEHRLAVSEAREIMPGGVALDNN
jgi:alpha-beta hydrolase superfamily lysophospholipase